MFHLIDGHVEISHFKGTGPFRSASEVEADETVLVGWVLEEASFGRLDTSGGQFVHDGFLNGQGQRKDPRGDKAILFFVPLWEQ